MVVSSLEKLPCAKENEETEVFAKLSRLTIIEVEPVGRYHKALCHRRKQKQTLSYTSFRSSSSEENSGDFSDEDEEDESILQTLDPKEWKDQDHYAVLGLSKLRVAATEEQIKRAYKRKVLKHHPDKRRARGVPVKCGEDDYFTCITRAWETLGVAAKKKSYDSIDPSFDDYTPSASMKDNFFEVYAPVFERNARWSNKARVPLLGGEATNFEDVEHFYGFWYDFDSWREFSYLDEEEKEKGENREERRWIEKQNKAARLKRKKEETLRIRNLVDNAYATDPRIAKFVEDAKQKKIRDKEAKKEASRKKQEEEEKRKQAILDDAKRIKDKEDEEARVKAAKAKEEREAQKKAIKIERKTLRTKVQEYDYFSSSETEKLKHMTDLDKVATMLTLLELEDINKELTSGDDDRAREGWLSGVAAIEAIFAREKQELLQLTTKATSSGGDDKTKGVKSNWRDDETTLLIKAVNLFPAGTMQRWDTVANFLSKHCEGSNRSAKEVLAKAKDLQKNDTALKQDANNKAFDKFSETKKKTTEVKADGGASKRYMSAAESVLAETGSNPAPWTTEEQKMLEQAIKTFPASVEARWDKISDAIPFRSKKDCMKRFKELAELVRAKKLAQIDAQKKKAKRP